MKNNYYMSNTRKHTDIVASMEEFTTNYNNGVYASPWIVYVGNNNDGYSVIYSNDENRQTSITPDVIESLKIRIQNLEDEKVYCYQEEYDNLVINGKGWVTNLDGKLSEVQYDANKLYCIYEDDGPIIKP